MHNPLSPAMLWPNIVLRGLVKNLAWMLWLVLSLSGVAQEPSVGFVFVGDTGTGTPAQHEVATAMGRYCRRIAVCQFGVLLGDNFYPAGVQSVSDPQWKTKFTDPYSDLKLEWFVALGNHDYQGNVQAQIDYSAHSPLWNLPSRYYSFSRESVDFFVIDTNDFDKKQRDWLEDELEHSQALWRIVVGHHPVFSYGQHGHSPSLIRDLLPLLESSADLYLAGHDHDKQVLKSGSVEFIISGGGAKLRPVSKGSKSLFAKSSLGFSHLLVDKGTARLQMLSTAGEVEFERIYSKRNKILPLGQNTAQKKLKRKARG